ncbi:phage holin family protein [Piscibacillus salipiscarius]|uniref:Phage holin family protein n=1 Tax=Piscibacillus salipiscarius TaxID=299480 RepID=A0ABW5QAN3_9BACI|nr:phage holin family protein [Piscibacillus salipiscarius]
MIKNWIISIVVNTIALLAVNELFQDVEIDGVTTAVIAAIILGILNAIVKPILVVLTLPITIISLGLFLFVINAITLMITQGLLGTDFVINGWGTAILAAIIITILNTILQKILKEVLD